MASVQVREAATRNLALLLPLIPNHDKYSTVQSACVQLATDCAEEVAAALLTQVVPALTAWLLHTDLLHTKLLPTLTTTTVAMLRESPRADNCYKVSGADPRAPAAHDRVKVGGRRRRRCTRTRLFTCAGGYVHLRTLPTGWGSLLSESSVLIEAGTA